MRSIRLSTALVVAAFATILTAGGALAGVPTPPEQQSGSVGPYLIRDGSQSTAASCDYPDSGALKLKAIIVKAPEVRWADTDSGNDNEHGRIGHRIIVQRSTDGGTTWTKVKASTRQVAGATESTAANLTKRTVSVSVSGQSTLLRVYQQDPVDPPQRHDPRHAQALVCLQPLDQRPAPGHDRAGSLRQRAGQLIRVIR